MRLLRSVVIAITATLHIYGEFSKEPASMNVTLGGIARFTCAHTMAQHIVWKVNGSQLDRNNPCARESQYMSGGITIHVLRVDATSYCNNTMAVCVAFTDDRHNSTEPSFLKVQGLLGAVSNPVVNPVLDSNGLHFDIMWGPPFSLDLTNIDPDVIYCIVMVDNTCGDNTLFSNCSILGNNLTLEGFSDNQAYEFTITPRSNVNTSYNGTSFPVRVEFPKYNVTDVISELKRIDSGATMNVELTLTEKKESSTLTTRPRNYSLSLISLDGNNDYPSSWETFIVSETSNHLKLGALSLPLKRRWNVTVLAYNCSQNPVTDIIELSTHDIQNVSVTSPSPGEVRVTYDLIQNATAIGLMAVVYSLEFSKTNIYYFQALSNTPKRNLSVNIRGIPVGHYGVSVFSVEHGGLPFSKSVLTPKDISVNNTIVSGESETEISIRYTIRQVIDKGNVCIECTFADDSSNFCVVIVHKTPFCITNSPCEQTVVNISARYRIARSGETASDCIGDIDLNIYKVGVIDGLQASDTSSSTGPGSACIIGLIVASVLILL